MSTNHEQDKTTSMQKQAEPPTKSVQVATAHPTATIAPDKSAGTTTDTKTGVTENTTVQATTNSIVKPTTTQPIAVQNTTPQTPAQPAHSQVQTGAVTPEVVGANGMAGLGAITPEEPPKPSIFARIWGKIRYAIRYVRWRISYILRSENFFTSTILGLTALFFIVFFVWAANMKLEKTVKAQGVVMAIIENQIVSHLEGGVIKSINVAQGDKVEAGQELIKIVNMDMRRDRDRYLVKKHFLEAVLKRLCAERDGTDIFKRSEDLDDQDLLQQLEILTQNKESLRNRIAILETQREKLIAEKETKQIQRRNLLQEWHLSAQQVEMLQPLVEEGIGSLQNLLQRQSEMARLKTSVDDLERAILALDINIREADEKITEEQSTFLQQVQEEIATNTNELNTVLSELHAIDRSIERSTLRAPISGTIHRMHTTTIGGIVRAGDPLIEIVPETTSIRIEAKVQPQDRTNIYNHQEAKVRPTSYSFSLDTMLLVDITSISAQTFFDDQTRSHYYNVFLESKNMPETEEEKARYKSFMPGMIVEVNILSGEESLLHYLFTPIIRGLNNALTERSTR